MAKLSDNWLTEKHIDFEYKKYVLLAFLQDVNRDFEVQKLYPSLKELVTNYKQVISIKNNKEELAKSFPQKAKELDTDTLGIAYEKLFEESELMLELENIINYSIPQFERYLAEGKKIYDTIEQHLTIFPVGVIPLHAKEGYIFIRDGKNADAQVYEYDITLFEQPEGKYRGIHTHYIKTFETGLLFTYQYIKLELIKEKQELPNPATYVIESEWALPIEETLLPIAKRRLLKFVEGNI